MLRFVLGLYLVCFSILAWAENAPRSAGLQAFIEALELEKEQTLDDETLVSKLNRAAVLLYQKGQYEPALLIAQINHQHAQNALGKEHPDTLSSFNNLATLYQSQGRYAEAEPLFQRVLQASESVLSKDHPDTLNSVNNLAALYQSQGRYAEAEPLYQRAVQANERVLGKEHPDTLTSVNNLASLYEAQGRYAEAEPLYQRTLQTSELVLGIDHPQTLGSANNLAFLYQSQGRYAEAKPLYQRVLQARERVLGKEHPKTFISVNNLATLYESQGRYPQAELLFQRALKTGERVLGKEHPDTLNSVNNLAVLYQSQGHHAEAEPLYQRVLRTRERILGSEHPQTLASINNLAVLYHSQGLYNEAETIYQHVLLARERILGKEHPETLDSTNNLAILYKTQGNYAEAEPLFKRALQTSVQVLGKGHQRTLTTRLNLATNLMNLNKAKQSLQQLQLYQAGLFQLAGRELRQEVDLRDKRQLLFKHSSFQDLAFSLVLQHPSAQTEQFAATVLLRWHQVESEEQLFLQRMVRHSGDPAIQALAQQLAEQRQQFSAAVNQKSIQRDALEALKQQLQTLERSLTAKSQPFKQHLAVRQVHASDIKGVLPDNTGLLVLRVFKPYNTKTSKPGKLHWLAAWLANDDKGDMRFRFYNLGPVEQSAALWLAAKNDAKANGALYEHLFAKLDVSLAAVDKLYIVPDGFLHLADFGSWRLPNGDYWLERQSIHRLNTARDLMRHNNDTQTHDFVALGGIDYGEFKLNRPERDKPKSILDETLVAQRNLATQNDDGFEFLPATLEEIDHFQRDFWDRNLIGKLRVTKGKEATEHLLKNIANPPRILHLATHGFYLEDKLNIQRPMVLSGLALANANQGLQGKLDKDQEDGILYAMEAVGLNLQGTELVTLSACETGQGEIDYSEGVYGLVLAFKLAGAKNVLMTLRKVNDAWAARFMKAFYFNWLKYPQQHPAIALRQTKLAFIKANDPIKSDPEFWSPYVLVETAQ